MNPMNLTAHFIRCLSPFEEEISSVSVSINVMMPSIKIYSAFQMLMALTLS